MIGEPRTIDGVVRGHLCSGCGVCAYLEPDRWRMTDVPAVGRRPLPLAAVNGRAPAGRGTDAVAACPGRHLEHERAEIAGAPFGGAWGPVLAVYECWATDPQVRHRGSSGGVITALAAHAVASGASGGVLQVRARPDSPIHNQVALSTTPEEVIAAAGSRYAPASPCEGLDLVEHSPTTSVVVGKPCDIAATRAAAARRPGLATKVALTVSIFCAGTPATAGTEQVIRNLGLEADDVARLDYRGEGWPGRFRVRTHAGEERSCSYEESWGAVLNKHRQWRCMICPDHTGEFADLSVGDPWYRPVAADEPGRSLVVVRTERGRAALLDALAAGAVDGVPVPLDRLPESQPNLATVRGAVWGRVIALRLAGARAPRYVRVPSLRMWLRLGLRAKAASFVGTLRRVRTKGLRRPEPTAAATSTTGQVQGMTDATRVTG